LFRALDVFHPYLAPDCVISFTGGEPLLAFGLLRRAVEHAQGLAAREGRQARFALTSNGSLLNDEILGFLERHEFSLVLSFDGLAQEVSRKKGSYDLLVSLIPRILARPRISLEVNSVFSPETVGCLSKSIELMVRMNVPRIDVHFAHAPPWTPEALLRLEEEIGRVGDFFLTRYDRLGDIPWADLRDEHPKAVHGCTAGVDRMAVSAQGTVWGCAIFPHYLKDKFGPSGCQDFCFGDIDAFAGNPGQIYAQKIAGYSDLRMDRFSTPEGPCLMCDEVEDCWICPLYAGLTTGKIGEIAPSICQRARILRKGKRRFLDQFERRDRRNSVNPAR
jgi:MoaA/NifB/PqqE/SkfB family radical SAM enzyme